MMSQQIGDLISREDTLTAFADYVGSGMSMNDYDALYDIVLKMPPKDRSVQAVSIDVLDEIKAELHATAEMHGDGDYYLREEWIDEIIDKYKQQESEEE